MGDDRATAVLLDTVLRHDLLCMDDTERQKLLQLLSDLRGEQVIAATAELVKDRECAAVVAYAELLLNKWVEKVENARRIQGADGTWNRDPYLLGMYNGLELAMSILEGREPVYRFATSSCAGSDDAD
jgi:hypothetical protein